MTQRLHPDVGFLAGAISRTAAPLRIAQIAPLYESVPPRLYGGTERVVSYLTEELVAQGHDVTLFASGDSQTSASLVAACPRSLRLDSGCIDLMAHHMVMIEQILRRASDFDILHFHIDYLHYPFSRRQGYPQFTTLHGRLDLPDLVPLYREFAEMPVISISEAQRRPLPGANWMGTVYHGLPSDLLHPRYAPGNYLAFLGRISPEKRVDRAIEIAIGAGLPLKIAAKVDRADQDYFDTTIRPLLRHPLIDFLGEIDEREKESFLGNALALLFPIDWPEPFGLVMIESLACGTPVVAWRHGSVPEIMTDGETGFIVQSMEEAIEAVQQISRIDRHRCRQVFEERFTASRMACDYTLLYRQMIGDCQQSHRMVQ